MLLINRNECCSRHIKAHAQEQSRPRRAGAGAGGAARGHVAHQRGQAQDRGPAADVRHLQRYRPVPGMCTLL